MYIFGSGAGLESNRVPPLNRLNGHLHPGSETLAAGIVLEQFELALTLCTIEL